MQQDVIGEILSVEENAQKLEQDAQTRSREMVMDAQEKANQYVRDALNAKREADRKELEKAEADADETLKSFTSNLDTGMAVSTQEADAIADKIIEKLCYSEMFSQKKES